MGVGRGAQGNEVQRCAEEMDKAFLLEVRGKRRGVGVDEDPMGLP